MHSFIHSADFIIGPIEGLVGLIFPNFQPLVVKPQRFQLARIHLWAEGFSTLMPPTNPSHIMRPIISKFQGVYQGFKFGSRSKISHISVATAIAHLNSPC